MCEESCAKQKNVIKGDLNNSEVNAVKKEDNRQFTVIQNNTTQNNTINKIDTDDLVDKIGKKLLLSKIGIADQQKLLTEPAPQALTPTVAGLSDEYNNIIDTARDQLHSHNPNKCIETLDNLYNRIKDQTIDNFIRFRILTNYGAAYLDLGNQKKCAEYFIEAFQYSPELEKAKINKALAHIFLRQNNQAQEIISNILKDNPICLRALSLHIQLSNSEEELESRIAEIPEDIKSETEISMAIGGAYLKITNDLLNAEEWYQKAVDGTEDPDINILATLAEIKLQIVFKENTALIGQQANEEQRKKLEDTISLFSKVIEKTKDTDFYNHIHVWINSRGVAFSILGDLRKAKIDFLEAHRLKPEEIMYSKNVIIYSIEAGDETEAMNIINDIERAGELPNDIAILKAQLLLNGDESNKKEGIKIITELSDTDEDNWDIRSANRLMINVYLENNQIEEAIKLNDELLEKNPTEVAFLIDKARILKKQNLNDETNTVLDKSLKDIQSITDIKTKKELADLLFFNQRYVDCWPIYETITDIKLESTQRYRFIFALYKSGQYKKVLELMEQIKEGGMPDYIAEIQSAIYEEIGDVPGAIETLEKYLEKKPDHFEIELSLANLYFRTGNIEATDEFLDKYKTGVKSDPKNIFQLAFLLQERGRDNEAFDLIFKVWRSNQGNHEVLSNYAFFILSRSKDKEDDFLLKTVERAGVGSAITVKNEDDTVIEYLLIDENEKALLSEELSISSKVGNSLIGKKRGDTVVINDISEHKLKIIDIQNKYLFAFNKTQKKINEHRVDNGALVSIKVKTNDGGEDIKNKLEQVVKNDKRKSFLDSVLELYKIKRLTTGALADITGKDYFETYNILTNTPQLGLYCSDGTASERTEALSYDLSEKNTLVIDLTALFTLFKIDIQDILVKHYPNIIVSNSTKQFIKDQVREYKNGMKSRERGFVYTDDSGEIRYTDVPNEMIEANQALLESIDEWIEKNCKIELASSMLDLETERKDKLNTILGKTFLETAMIATQDEQYVLLSDDYVFRTLSKNDLGTKGVWTQVLLMDLLNKAVIQNQEYEELVLKLLRMNYDYITINEKVVLRALEIDNWNPDNNVNIVSKLLNANKTSPDSAVDILIKVIYELWKKILLSEIKRNSILIVLLNNFIQNHPKKEELIKLFVLKIKIKFKFSPVWRDEILSLISKWKKQRGK